MYRSLNLALAGFQASGLAHCEERNDKGPMNGIHRAWSRGTCDSGSEQNSDLQWIQAVSLEFSIWRLH